MSEAGSSLAIIRSPPISPVPGCPERVPVDAWSIAVALRPGMSEDALAGPVKGSAEPVPGVRDVVVPDDPLLRSVAPLLERFAMVLEVSPDVAVEGVSGMPEREPIDDPTEPEVMFEVLGAPGSLVRPPGEPPPGWYEPLPPLPQPEPSRVWPGSVLEPYEPDVPARGLPDVVEGSVDPPPEP
jgi:hypothetical protein